jgi:hypothetical protein
MAAGTFSLAMIRVSLVTRTSFNRLNILSVGFLEPVKIRATVSTGTVETRSIPNRVYIYFQLVLVGRKTSSPVRVSIKVVLNATTMSRTKRMSIILSVISNSGV